MQSVKSAIAIALLKLCARLPLPWLHTLGSGLGRLIGAIPNKVTRVTRINIDMCLPEFSSDERKTLVKESLCESGKAIFEYGFVSLRPADEILGLIHAEHNIELLHDTMALGQGLIVITPHLGNWEVLSLFLARHYRVTGLYKPSRLVSADKLILEARSRTGSIPIPASPTGVVKVRRALSDGWLTVILPDQQPHKDNGIFVPFFGITAASMRLVSTLAKKSGAKILCMYASRLDVGKGYEIICKLPDPNVYSDDLEASVTAVNRSMEHCIRDIPAQYHWEYTRFSNRPEGEPLLYP
jgi:KDO2-lipid IV(A) lauroyltransferase